MGTHEKRTWIVVANRGRARVFEQIGLGPVSKVFDIPNPRGRLKSSEINADKSGRAFPRHGTGSSAMSKPHDPVLHEAEAFAKYLGEMLEHAMNGHRFEHLVLIAEPHFLGLIRNVLAAPTAARVVASFAKDLANADDVELERSLPAIAS